MPVSGTAVFRTERSDGPSLPSGEKPAPGACRIMESEQPNWIRRWLLWVWRPVFAWLDRHIFSAFRSDLVKIAGINGLYFFGGVLGKESSFMAGSVSLVWPPAGIALAAIVLFGYKFWLWV